MRGFPHAHTKEADLPGDDDAGEDKDDVHEECRVGRRAPWTRCKSRQISKSRPMSGRIYAVRRRAGLRAHRRSAWLQEMLRRKRLKNQINRKAIGLLGKRTRKAHRIDNRALRSSRPRSKVRECRKEVGVLRKRTRRTFGGF